jgi:trimeric autotransporter adhesin
MKPGRLRCALVLTASLLSATASSQCNQEWTPGFGERGLGGGLKALHVCDLGNGPHLYAGGNFGRVNNTLLNNISRWNGSTWEAVGLGFDAGVHALAAADLGAGVSLYAGGYFTLLEGNPTFNVARWSGTAWSSTTYNGSSGGKNGLKLMPGTPPALYGISDNMLSRTTGGPWLPVATVPPTTSLTALEVFDDGSGPAPFVAGTFLTMGAAGYNRLAKWTGTQWVSLTSGCNADVNALAVYDDGTGPALYVAGSFTIAGGVPSKRIAKWNGVSWSQVGGGIPSGQVWSLSVQDFGAGPVLVVGGSFATVGTSVAANNIATWNGSSWAALGAGVVGIPRAYAVIDEGAGPQLVVGGEFLAAGGQAVNGVARWDGTSWHPMPDGNGFSSEFNSIQCSIVWDDGGGPRLYVGGSISTAGSTVARGVARFDGSTWTSLGITTNPSIEGFAIYDDGTGPALYVCGNFTAINGIPLANVAKWTGTTWVPLGLGLSSRCYALEVVQSGPFAGTLAAAGGFTNAGGAFSPRVAFWNGSTWLSTWPATTSLPFVTDAFALANFDDGSGPAIYAGGSSGGVSNTWKFDGIAWTAVPGGPGSVRDFQIFDDGSGPALFASGLGAMNFARLVGGAWSAVPGSAPADIMSMVSHDDGTGSALYVGAADIGGTTAKPAKWDGVNFTPLGNGVGAVATPGYDINVETLASFDDGNGPALYAGGTFKQAGPHRSTLFARWAAPRPTLALSQSAPGGGVTIHNGGLVPGNVYHNVFSVETPSLVGGGPFLGLYATDPTPLLDQFNLPLGALPFHFTGTAAAVSFGPYAVPGGITFDGVTFEYPSGTLGCASTVKRLSIQ